jgi:hypothetical protein
MDSCCTSFWHESEFEPEFEIFLGSWIDYSQP